MIRDNPLRAFQLTVLVVAVLSITLGVLIATLTGQYIALFIVQLMIAGMLAARYSRIRKRSTAAK